jgi:hypothetical protein
MLNTIVTSYFVSIDWLEELRITNWTITLQIPTSQIIEKKKNLKFKIYINEKLINSWKIYMIMIFYFDILTFKESMKIY